MCGTFTLWVNGKTTLDEEIQALEALDGVSFKVWRHDPATGVLAIDCPAGAGLRVEIAWDAIDPQRFTPLVIPPRRGLGALRGD